jgi:hypothetical protein
MTDDERRYTEDDVSRIIRHALSDRPDHDTISHEELVEIAASSGIDRDRLESVIDEMEANREIEAARAEWVRRRREKFQRDFTVYLVMSAFFVVLWLLTSRSYFWPIWPILAWGLGMFFEWKKAYMMSEAAIERGARRILRQNQLRQHEIGG